MDDCCAFFQGHSVSAEKGGVKEMKRGVVSSVYIVFWLFFGLFGIYHAFRINPSGATIDQVIGIVGLGFAATGLMIKQSSDSINQKIDQAINSINQRIDQSVNSINQRITDHQSAGHPKR